MLRSAKDFWLQFLAMPNQIKVIIASSFFMAAGSFMVTPFVAIYLREHLKVSVQTVGVVIAATAILQFAGSIPGAYLAEKIGYKKSMLAALAVRTLSFVGLAFTGHSPPGAIASVLVIAACSALYMPANKAYTIHSIRYSNRALLLTYSSTAFNAGMAIGPLIAGVLIASSAKNLFLTVALLFGVLVLVHSYFLQEDVTVNAGTGVIVPEQAFRSDFGRLWPKFLLCSFSFYLFFLFQNFMGLHLSNLWGSQTWGLILFLNLLVLAMTQVIGHQWITKTIFAYVMAVGFSLFGVGILLMGSDHLFSIIIGVLLFTVGQGAIFLWIEIEFLNSFSSRPAVAFGAHRLATGVGGLLCGLFGGLLYETHFFWKFVAIQTLLVSVFIGIVFCTTKKAAYETAR